MAGHPLTHRVNKIVFNWDIINSSIKFSGDESAGQSVFKTRKGSSVSSPGHDLLGNHL